MTQGSPPRVRGRGRSCRGRGFRFRITPARAGKSQSFFLPAAFSRDHPRACGEEKSSAMFSATSWGSPPRVRGRGSHTTIAALCRGITPARAGKRLCPLPGPSSKRDHPRMRGEETSPVGERRSRPGSPPHARGRARVRLARRPRPRITPACAGKRSSGCPKGAGQWDHPRACGEEIQGEVSSVIN